MILFITGTDTNVGKTYISSILISYLRDKNISVDYLKPIETGVENIPEDAYLISSILGKTWQECVLYTFKKPMSPYACSLDECIDIDIGFILEEIEKRQIGKILIVEGAGGIAVPIKPGIDYSYLIEKINAIPLIVARASLGTLNHSFLTYFYLKSKNIKPLGIILNGFDYKEPSQQYNETVLRNMIYDKVNIYTLNRYPNQDEVSKIADNIYKSIANF